MELYYPAKPYIVRQGFGIYNPAYEQFGFNKHNGIDFAVDADGIVRAMCQGIVTEVHDYVRNGQFYGAGKAVRYRTTTPVTAEGQTAYVEFMYMHADKQLVGVGDIVTAGTPIIVADNTGFSTGPHTHISAYFIDINSPTGNNKLPYGDKDADYCFDFSKYYNGKYADDVAPGAVKPTVPTALLKFGDKASTDVRNLQSCLQYLGYMTKGLFGPFGPATRDALAKFQIAHNIYDLPQGTHYGPKSSATLRNNI